MERASSPAPASKLGEAFCLECDRPVGHERGWRAFRCDLDDTGRDDVLIYCPRCSEREFGESYEHAQRTA